MRITRGSRGAGCAALTAVDCEDGTVNLPDVLRVHRLLAVVRGVDPEAALDSVLALAEAGISLIEVSVTSKDEAGVLVRARAALGPDAPLGAGTLLTEADVVQAEQAGASFVVTPGLVPAVAEAVRLGIPALVGALTPTEVVSASRAGAAAVKLFPASLGGPAYLRTLREPFPDVPFVPYGGVDVESAPEYLSAGAVAVGVAEPLLGAAPGGGDLAALRLRAAAFRAAIS